MTRSNKIGLRLLAGGLFGALIGPGLAHLVMYFDLSIGTVTLTPGGVVLTAVGGLYTLMGLFVWVGVIWPQLGVLILNVADEEDLRERRPMLCLSALTSVALGAAMVFLPLSGQGGPIAPAMGLAGLVLALLLTFVSSWSAIAQRHFDELWRRLTAEAAATSLAMLSVVMIVWGSAAFLGWAAPLDPLLVVAAPPALFLLACFIAAGRKGMLMAE